MTKEWGFDKPIPRGYFAKAEDFPPDFVEKAETRLKKEDLPTGETASLYYELGRFKFMVEENPAEATFDFGRARDASERHLTIDADARRWISRCIDTLSSASVEIHLRTLAALLNTREEADLVAVYEACDDMAGLGMLVLDRLDRETRLHCLNLCAYASNPERIESGLPSLEDGITTADRFLAKLDRAGVDSNELRDIRKQVEKQGARMRLFLEFTKLLAHS